MLGNSLEIEVLMGEFFIDGKIGVIGIYSRISWCLYIYILYVTYVYTNIIYI